MGFIADKIRIAKDGSVTTIVDPADKSAATKTVWTAKMVCEHISMSASVDVTMARTLISKLMNDYNFHPSHVAAMLSWMDQNWNCSSVERRAYLILNYFHHKCP